MIRNLKSQFHLDSRFFVILFSYNQGNIACSRLSASGDEWTGGRNRRGKEWKDPSSSQTFPIFSHTCLSFRSSLLYQSFTLHSVANKVLLKRLFYVGLIGVYRPTFSPTPQLQRKFWKILWRSIRYCKNEISTLNTAVKSPGMPNCLHVWL